MKERNSALRPRRVFAFLDRDGTLIEDCGYPHRASDYRPFPDAKPALRRLQEAGFGLAVVSNQSGVGRGLFSVEDLWRMDDLLRRDFATAGVLFEGTYYCPHARRDHCRCRKPLPGLIEQACREHPIDLSCSWVIGDKASDIELAHNVGCRGALVLTGPDRQAAEQVPPGTLLSKTLTDAALSILHQDASRRTADSFKERQGSR